MHRSDLPLYMVINHQDDQDKSVLTRPAQEVKFPLNEEDRHVVDVLTQKFRQEKDAAGLAAPQIGFAKRIIIFATPDDSMLKKWRPDHTQIFPETLWINPTYERIGTAKHRDGEGCFSVKDLRGMVDRFKKIHYQAYTVEGEKVEGIAEGYSARVIQHEIDHTNGILFIDLLTSDQVISKEEYKELKESRLKKE